MAIFSTAYLPTIAFFLEYYKNDQCIIDCFENYQRKKYYNRTYILSPQGKTQLTVPVVKNKNQKTELNNVLISYDTNWQVQHWKSIQSAYQNSPYFTFYKDKLKEILFFKHEYLKDLNDNLLTFFIETCQLQNKVSYSKNYIPHQEDINIDTRLFLLPNKEYKNYPIKEFQQVFKEDNGFIPNLSILDLVFNEGPNTELYLLKCLNKHNPLSNRFKFPN